MTDDHVDLSALDSVGDALPSAIAARCGPLLAARRQHATIVYIERWWWPALAASLVIAVGSAFLLMLPFERVSDTPRRMAVMRSPAPRLQLAEAVGIPRVLARSLTNRSAPSLSDLLEARR